MIDLVAENVSALNYKRVGVLATPTTIKFDLYGKALSKKGIKVFYPTDEAQKLHEKIIREILSGEKNTDDIKKLEITTRDFVQKDTLDGVILGCTELPLVFPKVHFNNVIDCMEVLADKLLEKYYDIPEE
jgi:aspartate racemase